MVKEVVSIEGVVNYYWYVVLLGYFNDFFEIRDIKLWIIDGFKIDCFGVFVD